MTSTTLRPNATISDGGATFTGGTGTWHGNTSDDSDTSYATLPVGNSASLGLGTVSMAAGSVTKQARVRARVRADSSTTRFDAGLYSETGIRLSAVSAAAVGTTITTYTGSYAPVSLTQTQVDGLQVLAATAAQAAASARFIEFYVDLVYVTQPVVTVIGLTTVVTSSFTVGWDFAPDADGGAQTAYQVKVFTDAVFDGGGFNPDTSTAIYDSGIVAGSEPNAFIGPVEDGTNHHVHVRAAETINGELHWSAWSQDEFTVNAPSPEVLTVTPVATGSSIVVTVARNTGAASWTAVTVERSFDSGTTWEFVRGASFAAASGNSFVVTDYEVPNGRSVLYRARAHDATTTGAWVQAASAVSWSSSAIWLKSITSTSTSQIVALQVIPDYSLSETQTQTLAIQTETAASATSLETLLGPPRRVGVFHVLGATHPVTVADGGSTLLLQYPASHGLTDRYLTVTGYSQGFIAGPGQQTVNNISLRVFNVETVTVARPADTASS